MIAIPFFFQLIVFGIYGKLLEQSEYLAKREYHLKAVVGHTNWLAVLLSVGTLGCAAYVLTGDKDYLDVYEYCKKLIPKEASTLSYLLRDNKEHFNIAERLEMLSKKLVFRLDELKRTSGQKAPSMIEVAKLRPIWHELVTSRRQLLAYEKLRYPIGPESLPSTRESIKQFVYVALAVNVVTAFILILMYSRGIAKRLEVLTENSLHLARGEPLKPLVTGFDEIAVLDKSFRYMANALAQAQRKERAVLDNMMVGLITFDQAGIIESTNPRIEKIFGYTNEELKGKHIMTFFPETLHSDPSTFTDYLFRISANKISELDAQRKNGDIVPIELSIVRFETKDGDLFLANVLDVSERLEVEKLKREFVATVTHELRTPLTSIRGSLTLLTTGKFGHVSDAAMNLIKIAERNTHRLILLINDILDIEKLEAGKIELHPTNVSWLSVVMRSLEAVKAYAEQYDVNLESRASAARIYGDEDRLVQVLVNLLSNAVKFSRKEGTVTIEQEEHSGWLRVKVIDRGVGIPAKYKELIFQKFLQVKSIDPRHKGGTGLGLSICKEIIEQHGGEIDVLTEEGKGSTFWFTVTLAKN